MKRMTLNCQYYNLIQNSQQLKHKHQKIQEWKQDDL
ncbi:hypothetical protein SLEP1_g25288 [Rubroshorea leprosula]|uniref:Uncharacterized protein n=1 Tax=Rubroshorea leprosula TaxID=152421 RepID=A0AAV5JPM7_9ROSI|nr:hypothetical protein SLEP1_g25288 [Rubroshorea leprosula]